MNQQQRTHSENFMLSKPINQFSFIRLPASQTGYYWDLPYIYDSWPTPKVNHRLSLHKKASEYDQKIPQSHCRITHEEEPHNKYKTPGRQTR